MVITLIRMYTNKRGTRDAFNVQTIKTKKLNNNRK